MQALCPRLPSNRTIALHQRVWLWALNLCSRRAMVSWVCLQPWPLALSHRVSSYPNFIPTGCRDLYKHYPCLEPSSHSPPIATKLTWATPSSSKPPHPQEKSDPTPTSREAQSTATSSQLPLPETFIPMATEPLTATQVTQSSPKTETRILLSTLYSASALVKVILLSQKQITGQRNAGFKTTLTLSFPVTVSIGQKVKLSGTLWALVG